MGKYGNFNSKVEIYRRQYQLFCLKRKKQAALMKSHMKEGTFWLSHTEGATPDDAVSTLPLTAEARRHLELSI